MKFHTAASDVGKTNHRTIRVGWRYIGTPVFAGTRVPIQTLFDYLMDGCELAAFLDNFPSVSQEAALTILAYAGSQVTRELTTA